MPKQRIRQECPTAICLKTSTRNPLNPTELSCRYRYSSQKVATKKRDNNGRTASQKIAILEYLTDHPRAKCSDISAMLDVKDARARRILSEMITEGTVVEKGGNRNRTYRLKS